MHLYLTHRWTDVAWRGRGETARKSRCLMVRVHLHACGRSFTIGGERLLYEEIEMWTTPPPPSTGGR